MLTERGKSDYPLPDDFGHITSLAVDEREQCGRYVPIILLSQEEMAAMRDKDVDALGVPTFATIANEALWLYPAPDDAYNILARYEPVAETF